MATAAPSEAAASKNINFREVLPKIGLVHSEHTTNWILCKPKIMPLKSFTLQKMETMQVRLRVITQSPSCFDVLL